MLLAAAVAASLGACSTFRSERKQMMGHIVPPQHLLNGTATFAGGVVAVQAWLGPSVRLKKDLDAERERPRTVRRADEEIGFNPAQQFVSPFEDREGEYSQEELDDMYGRSNFAHVLPPRLALTIKLGNASAHPCNVTIVDVNSTLGNFAARPEKVTLVPGEQVTLDPMLSNLDTNFDELVLTVTLKTGPQRETQQLMLRRAAESPPPPRSR